MGISLREQIAALEHEQWVAWSRDIAQSAVITPERLARWKTRWGDYDTLTEAQKDQYREWVDRVLAICAEAPEQRTWELEAKNARLKGLVHEYNLTWNAAEERALALRIPCRCDPPGSGEACNGLCHIRNSLEDTLREHGGSFDRFSAAHVMEMFDEAVETVVKERTHGD